ncbi:MAG: recombinase family protein [Mobilitalea sp.]
MVKNRAVLYCRLSKEDIDKVNIGDDSASIINQRLLLTDYALSQGFEIVNVYQDDDYSGLFSDRPNFEKLIKDAKLQKFDVVIAKSQSRFTRNMEHMEKYLHNIFPLLGIRFLGVVDNADTFNKGNKKSRQINGLINEWYCEDLSENIKAVFHTKMKDGQFIGSSCSYGYLKDPQDHNHLIIDSYAAEIVQRIFQLYINGVGKTRIGAILSDDGILIPSDYKVKILKQNYHNSNAIKTTELWSYQTIHQILNNEVYIGNTVQNKCQSLSYKSKLKKAVPKDEWIKVEDTHDAIIDINTWNLVQEIGKTKSKIVNADNKVGLFSGKLFCDDCGHTMVRYYNKKSEFKGYYCKTYKQHGNKFCSSHIIDDKELQDIILNCIKEEAKKILNRDDISELSSYQIGSKQKTEVRRNIQNLEKQKDEIHKYQQKFFESFADGIFTKEEFLKNKQVYNEQEDEMDKKITNLKDELISCRQNQNQYDEWVLNFKNHIKVKELNRSIIVQLVDWIKILNDGSISIKYKFSNPYVKANSVDQYEDTQTPRIV